jgi:hypothetical protein
VKPFDRFSAAAPARTRRAAVVAVLAVALVAGLVVWPGTPAESKYLQAATAGGDYLVAQMNADGSFVYEYDPITRKKSSSYNMLRHAGTTFSLIELHEATGDAKYLAAKRFTRSPSSMSSITTSGGARRRTGGPAG